MKRLILALLLAAAPTFAADTKISALGAGGAVGDADMFVIARAGANFQVLGSQFCRVASCTMTAPILQANGTAAAPSYSFSGTTNTGLFSTSAGVIQFSLAGTEGFRLSSTGVAHLIVNEWRTGSAGAFNWSSAANPASAGADTGLARSAAGVVKVTNGAAGNGTITAPGTGATSGFATSTVGAQFASMKSNGSGGMVFGNDSGFAAARVIMSLPAGGSPQIGSTDQWAWSSAGAGAAASDTGLTRASAGVITTTNGSSGQGIFITGAGNVTTPGVSFTGNTNSGILSPGAGNFAITAGGVGRLSYASGQWTMGSALQLGFGSTSDPIGSVIDVGFVRLLAGVMAVQGTSTNVGKLLHGRHIFANTTTNSASEQNSEMLWTNTGDGDGSVINLPDNPTIGVSIQVAVRVAQTITVNAQAGETIQDAGTSGTSTASSTVGSTIYLVAITGGSGAVWQVMFKTGTWSTT